MEEEDENYFLSSLTQRVEKWDEEDEEDSSLLSSLVKMEADEEEEKETFLGVMAGGGE
jgi:hypothetical protein